MSPVGEKLASIKPVGEKLVWFGKDFFSFWEKYLEEIEGVQLEEVKDSLLWTPTNLEVMFE